MFFVLFCFVLFCFFVFLFIYVFERLRVFTSCSLLTLCYRWVDERNKLHRKTTTRMRPGSKRMYAPLLSLIVFASPRLLLPSPHSVRLLAYLLSYSICRCSIAAWCYYVKERGLWCTLGLESTYYQTCFWWVRILPHAFLPLLLPFRSPPVPFLFLFINLHRSVSCKPTERSEIKWLVTINPLRLLPCGTLVILSHLISFHFISFHFISFHFISFHFISFHFISFHFLLYIVFCISIIL